MYRANEQTSGAEADNSNTVATKISNLDTVKQFARENKTILGDSAQKIIDGTIGWKEFSDIQKLIHVRQRTLKCSQTKNNERITNDDEIKEKIELRAKLMEILDIAEKAANSQSPFKVSPTEKGTLLSQHLY